jgi:CheY-like chemotaxis protein
VRQILTNLVGNAVKFTATGHVEIAIGCPASPANGKAQISFAIRDTGIGIRPDRLDKLFKPFSQVDSSVNRTHGGTGLGLAICHRLVTLMGGMIAVTSEQEKGSEFTFTLAFAETTATPDQTSRKESELKGKAILVVDDYVSNRRLFKDLLERHGAVVTVAASAEEALTCLDRQNFDLAALDYVMPEMNGISLGWKIRHDLITGLPLVLVSSVVLPQGDIPKGVFDEVITKPVKNSRFSETLARVLLKQKMPVAVSAAPVSQATFGLRHPLRILAVDDNPVNIKVISLTLTSMGYAPVIADSAAQALERLQTEKFDLVLMDVQMPGMDGHEATRVLRSGVAGELNRRVRVCALSASALAQERIACTAAGMDDFIPKPLTRPALTEKLAAAYAQKSEELLEQGFKAALAVGRAK